MPRNKDIPVLIDVARLAGVSLPTASSVINGHGKKFRISEATRNRVLAAAKELNYQANPFARGLRSKRSNCIGILWSFCAPHGSSSLIRVFSQIALQHGYSVQVYDSLSDPKLVAAQLKEFRNRRVDGVIIQIPCYMEIERIAPFLGDSVIAVSNSHRPLPCRRVVQAPERAMIDAIDHLIRCGRKQVAFLNSAENDNRYALMREIWMARGMPEDSIVHLYLPAENLPTPADIAQAFDAHPHLDAIHTATDELAAVAIKVLRQQGRRVPEEIAVIGYNNVSFAALFDPPIASIERCDEYIARRAMELLLEGLKNESASDGAFVTDFEKPLELVDMTFVWRESAGAPP